jgi:23S rRNA pseudouridine1911/1915/1917 synthase
MESVSAGSESKTPEIIWEDDLILVLNKPAGLVVHADGRTKEPTLSDWIASRYPHLRDIGGEHTLDSGRYVPRWGLLHRIDRETSGVLLVAKTDEAFYFFQRQFLDHSTEKTYLAFVAGCPKEKEGIIDAPIGRSRIDFRQWTVGEEARGTLRKAVTHFTVLLESNHYAELEVSPKTGRTHQIRVHLKSLGTPILCDTRYGAVQGLSFERLALHAWKIAITYPNGERKTFVAPKPADVLRAEELLGRVDL